MNITLADLRGGYVELLRWILATGQRVTSRSLDARELTGARIIFTDPLAPLLPIAVGRRVNLKLAAVEALQLIAGTFDADLVARAAPTFSNVLVDPLDPTYGAYGPRVGYAIGDCLRLLQEDPGTRQAVVSIWRPEDLEHVGDKPCTVFLQFLIRPDVLTDEITLQLFTYMRSQDAWLGVPYDIFMFSQLQHTIARELKIPAGRYVHTTTSMHIYERNVAAVTDLIHRWDGEDHSEQLVTDLPLGVVVTDTNDTGFDVANYLIDYAYPKRLKNVSSGDVNANAWYAQQMTNLRSELT